MGTQELCGASSMHSQPDIRENINTLAQILYKFLKNFNCLY